MITSDAKNIFNNIHLQEFKNPESMRFLISYTTKPYKAIEDSDYIKTKSFLNLVIKVPQVGGIFKITHVFYD